MIALPTILSLAIKYANTLGRIHLAERLTELEPEIKAQKENQKIYDEPENANAVSMSTPSSAHLLNVNSSNTTPRTLPVS